MDYGAYIFVVVVAVAIMVSAVYALYWAVKTGQFQQFEKGATSIFDDEEPEGQVTDFFPRKSGRSGLRPDALGMGSPAGVGPERPVEDRSYRHGGQPLRANSPGGPRLAGDASPDDGNPT